MNQKASLAFVVSSWMALGIGFVGYLLGLLRSTMELNEKGFYLVIIMSGLFAAVSVQKAVRDKAEKVPVTNIYYGLSWFATIFAVAMLIIGLLNSTLEPSEKGFYAFAFILSLFGAITVQKNTRDNQPVVNVTQNRSQNNQRDQESV